MDFKSNYYDQILQRYRNTIAVQFFGHSHKVCYVVSLFLSYSFKLIQDQFEIAYSDYNNQIVANAVGIALIGPALTPTSESSGPSRTSMSDERTRR